MDTSGGSSQSSIDIGLMAFKKRHLAPTCCSCDQKVAFKSVVKVCQGGTFRERERDRERHLFYSCTVSNYSHWQDLRPKHLEEAYVKVWCQMDPTNGHMEHLTNQLGS